ncbi:MAG: lysostaphin resistance A-like protein [Phycisphaerales bacterium]
MSTRRTDASRRLKARGTVKHQPDLGARDDYWTLSARPLHAFAFLLVPILLYELGSLLYLTDIRRGIQQSVKAKTWVDTFFQQFGIHESGLVGMLLPGIACLAVLLCWHILNKDRWQVRPMILLGMLFEAALWTLPLLVLGGIKSSMASHFPHAAALAAGPMAGADLQTLSLPARATISIGAGIYEELVFRLAGLGIVHFVLRDMLKTPEAFAKTFAVLATAIGFALYHPDSLSGGSIHWLNFGFYVSAGIYFGALFLYRGFGIVVATHAIYDIVVLVFMPSTLGR